MKKKLTIITALIFMCIFSLFAEELSETEPKKETSEFEEKRDVILYGTGEDILNLIKTLQEDKDGRFDSDLQRIFAETKIPELRTALFEYFAKNKNDCLKTDALILLENRYDYPKNTVSAAVRYIRSLEIYDGIQYLREILKDGDEELTDISISAIGTLGKDEDAVFLTELFESEASENEKKSLIKKQNIMLALEELHSSATWDFLKAAAEDTDENSYIRAAAASALGKIGDEKAVPILSSLFEDKDPVLRTAAVKGLAGFKTEEAQAVLLQAFKDGYYKVRLQAVQSAKDEKNALAVKHIVYRAKKDPENAVRYAAIEALSEFNDYEANEWAVETFNTEKTEMSIRLKIAEYFLKNNFDTVYTSVEKETLSALTNRQKNKFAAELGKIISKIENEATAPIAEAFMNHKEASFKSIGLDMFKRNKYASLVPLVSAIAADEKNGALSRRAKDLLAQAGYAVEPEKKQDGADNSETPKADKKTDGARAQDDTEAEIQ